MGRGFGPSLFSKRVTMKIYTGYVSTWKIIECLDASEYSALSDFKKDALRMIISVGRISVSENSIIRNLLLETIFPEGTNTHTALCALLETDYVPQAP
jgi:hypothetical protein